jgi:hypothetical protein
MDDAKIRRNVGDLVVVVAAFEDTNNVGEQLKEEGVKNASDATARRSKVPMKKNIIWVQVDWGGMATFCLFVLYLIPDRVFSTDCLISIQVIPRVSFFALLLLTSQLYFSKQQRTYLGRRVTTDD